MKLAKLREIASKRSKGKWSAVSDLPLYAVACGEIDVVTSSNRLYRTWYKKHGCVQEDAEFIALSANHFDALLDLAEAGVYYSDAPEVVDALERLEAVE